MLEFIHLLLHINHVLYVIDNREIQIGSQFIYHNLINQSRLRIHSLNPKRPDSYLIDIMQKHQMLTKINILLCTDW